MKKQLGITLIETMLALSVASVIVVLGIQQMQSYSTDNQVREIKDNIDQLFQAMAAYYQVQCRLSTNLNASTLFISTGANSLVTLGFLANWSPITNPLVDSSVGENGYSISFNQLALSARTPTSIFYNWTGSATTPIPLSFTTTVGTISLWRSHISLKLSKNLDPLVYKGRLGATCTGSSAATTCAANSPGQYIIWESLPTYASPSTISNLKSSLPRVQAFTNLYYTDDMYSASNPTWGTVNNNYLCGG